MFWTSAKQRNTNVIRSDGMLVFMSASFGQISPACRGNSPQPLVTDFNSKTRSVFHPHAHNALSVTAMRVCNPDRSPVEMNRSETGPVPSGSLEIVGNDFLVCVTDCSRPLAAQVCSHQPERSPSVVQQ